MPCKRKAKDFRLTDNNDTRSSTDILFEYFDEVAAGWPKSQLIHSADTSQTDPACSFCDDGGLVAPCDGLCVRSFHVGLSMREDEHSSELDFSTTVCNCLQVPEDLARHIITEDVFFECPSCFSGIHHCYQCHREGDAHPSHTYSSKTIARCTVHECGRFYHPECISKKPDQIGTAAFRCPRHECAVRAENGTCRVPEGESTELVQCRRCPTAYHRQCVPKSIMATATRARQKRVWFKEGGEVERSLVYCMSHDIPKGKDNPPLEAPLFSPELLKRWRKHMNVETPHLTSSREWLKHNGEINSRMSAYFPAAKPARS